MDPEAVSPLPRVVLEDPAVWQDLHAAFAGPREASPLGLGGDGGLIVLRQAEALGVLRDRVFAATDLLAIYGLDHGPVWEWWRLVMSSRNPPEHTRVRGTVSRAFTPRSIERLRPRIAELATELLEPALHGGGSFDVIEGFANQLPSLVMAHMLDIPDDDQAMFSGWTSDIGLIFGAAAAKDTGLLAHIEEVLAQLYAYVGELTARRRAQPGEDLLSELIAAEETGGRLSGEELAALVANLLFAGHDTTRSQLMITFALLAQHPDQFAALRHDLSLVANATEEILRFEPAVFGSARQPLEDVVVGGVTIPAGVPLQVSLVAASRDPRAWDQPDRFDVTRVDPRPVDFGGGIHHCLGAALARCELQEALRLLATRVDAIELVEQPQWVPYAAIRRFADLQVTLRSR